MNKETRADLSQWDDDGGSSSSRSTELIKALQELAEEDQTILAFLGVSVIDLWGSLPLDQQQKIVNTAAVNGAFDRAEVKNRIQRVERILKQKL